MPIFPKKPTTNVALRPTKEKRGKATVQQKPDPVLLFVCAPEVMEGEAKDRLPFPTKANNKKKNKKGGKDTVQQKPDPVLVFVGAPEMMAMESEGPTPISDKSTYAVSSACQEGLLSKYLGFSEVEQSLFCRDITGCVLNL
ncbi:hypothetical protein CEXT_769341 [Caerostris extrusa]|uniref:Uncharacterized protein n=1 Tax=Caerostris extrusa TaxID=172846 RepID=A0AAV4P3Q5_CAEEX|nr:hypothetical protein CEXT_769341 [Caerostris extrusa]